MKISLGRSIVLVNDYDEAFAFMRKIFIAKSFMTKQYPIVSVFCISNLMGIIITEFGF